MAKIVLLFLLFCSHCILMTSQSNLIYTKDTYLDPEEHFRMSWSYNSSHIIFELTVITIGWIAIGFSPNGNMVDADIHLGWVDNGKVHITTDTMRVIYAYDDDDPDQDGNFNKHTFQHRGTKFLLLFQPQAFNEYTETDVSTFDFRANNSVIPIQLTYYKCTLVAFPPLDKKHHVVKKEPILEEQHRSVVHHIVAYGCANLESSNFVGIGQECFTEPHPHFNSCHVRIDGWAPGKGAKLFPHNAGYPIGEPGGFKYLKLVVHYNNPEMKKITDASGLRIHYTPTLRKYDAGLLEMGRLVLLSQLTTFIPPRIDSFKIYSGCDEVCIANGMDQEHIRSINIFRIGLHGHVLARKIKLRHIRNGTELPLLVRDDNFIFEFHRGHLFSPEIVFKKGDSLQIVCDYSSAERAEVTVGGTSTTQEMCDSFIYYYPQLPVTQCFSAPTNELNILTNMMGITGLNFTKSNKSLNDTTLDDFIVTSPQDLANQTILEVVNNYKWDKTSADYFSRKIRRSQRLQVCMQLHSRKFSTRRSIAIKHPLEDKPEIKVCKAPSTGFPTEVPTDICGII